MSQHDFNIANQGFPAFRSDLNDALVALGTNSSGATAPATTFAHQFWMDTAADPSILKVRNADNDAWITLGTFNQTTDTFTPAGVTSDKIEEGNSKVEVVDTGTGYIVFEVDGAEVARFNPDQLVTKAGTASTPAISPTGDLNTGIFFPAADTIAFAEGGAEAMRISDAGNVGIGTTSPAQKLTVYDSTNARLLISTGASGASQLYFGDNASDLAGRIYYEHTDNSMRLYTNESERARITSSGVFLVSTTSAPSATNPGVSIAPNGANGMQIAISNTISGQFEGNVIFINANGQVGSINTNASATAYVTSSDYRLKHDIQPMTGALTKVAQLKPVTYKWNVDNSESQGFIAHELQEVMPECVSGEKDAINEDGSIKPQGVDTSFLVATLTAAIQELSAKNDALEARIAALEAVPGNE